MRIYSRLILLFFLLSCSSGNEDDSASNDPNTVQKRGCPGDVTDSIPSGNNDVLIWAEEFDEEGSPCSHNWIFEGGNNNGWGNNEQQYYKRNDPDNVIIEDGILKITLIKEKYNGYNYTSTRMTTFNKFDFKYGKIEVRAKLPQGRGTWPAIWMLGKDYTNVGWPACGEIDIMEHKGSEPGLIHGSLHTPSSHGDTTNTEIVSVDDVSTQFHDYEVIWTEEKIQFLVDDKLYYTYSPTNKNSSNWPYDDNFFIILNIAMGGNFGGSIDPNFSQSSMEIDYIRVYQ
jgi:beta-glucanase (GH16 family)